MQLEILKDSCTLRFVLQSIASTNSCVTAVPFTVPSILQRQAPRADGTGPARRDPDMDTLEAGLGRAPSSRVHRAGKRRRPEDHGGAEVPAVELAAGRTSRSHSDSLHASLTATPTKAHERAYAALADGGETAPWGAQAMAGAGVQASSARWGLAGYGSACKSQQAGAKVYGRQVGAGYAGQHRQVHAAGTSAGRIRTQARSGRDAPSAAGAGLQDGTSLWWDNLLGAVASPRPAPWTQ